MSVAIYYFSGTGNSLLVAKDVAKSLQGDLTSIHTTCSKKKVQCDVDVLGIVFPVYFAEITGIPFIVQDFIRKLTNLEDTYVFAIATHQGGPGSTMENVQQAIQARGGKLASGFLTQLSKPYPALLKVKASLFNKDLSEYQNIVEYQNLLLDWRQKLSIIVDYIKNRSEGTIETHGKLKKLLLYPYLVWMRLMYKVRYKQLSGIDGSFEELVKAADNSFIVNESCNSCRTCSRVCPVENIQIVESKPNWLHHCENCTACYVWCPQDAIGGPIVEYNRKIHHPEISLTDMLREKNIRKRT